MIPQSKSALDGERKQVTVLFADVQGSMDLAEQMDPEAWSAVMGRFFAILSEAVERFEGFVDKFTGDGIMALFGAPIAHEDHAQRACWAALRAQEAVSRYATEVKREHGVGFSMRVGLHTGEVVVGNVGASDAARGSADSRPSYTAQGHTVGLAQRMEALASPDTCYLSAATAELVRGYFVLDDLGAFRVKGMSEPVGVCRLVGPGSLRTRFDASRSRGLTRFVGRAADLRLLEDALATAQAGAGQVVGIVAEAGTGKSRLCHELAERCRARGLTVSFASALAHGKHIPYLPMLEIFRRYFGITEQDDGRVGREKIAGRLLLLDESLREVLPVLFEFFGVSDPAWPVPTMDPDAKQRQIFAVLRRVIQAPQAGAGHFVVVIEDLHWLDAASERLLTAWIDAIPGSTALLVLNFRPEYRADWMQRSWYRRLPLAPLGPTETRELLDDLLGTDPSVAGLADRIHHDTGGNPFFTEEVVQALVDAGDLVGRRGAYRLAVDAASIRVPPSVQGILAARIDRLPEREKLVLQTGAVIGQTFTEPILATVTELPGDAVRAVLAHLQAAELVYEQSPFPVAEYVFKHPLTREVALGSQLKERRRRLHALTARAIEAASPDKLDEQAALLAHHWEEADEALLAATWQTRAALWARRSDFAASGRHLVRARELLRRAPDALETARLGVTVCRGLLALGFRVGLTVEEGQEVFTEGLAWAARLDDPLAVARLHQAVSVLHGFHYRFEPALAHAREWEREARAQPDPELRAYAVWPLLGPLVLSGDLASARRSTEELLAATKEHSSWGLGEWALSAHGNALVQLSALALLEGCLEDARRLADESIAVSRGVGDREGQVAGLLTLARHAFFAGEPEPGRVAVPRALELCDKLGSDWVGGDARLHLGGQLLLEGEDHGAIEVLEALLAEHGARVPAVGFLAPVYLAEALRRVGEPVRALTTIEEAWARLRALGARPMCAESGIVLARVLRDAGGATAERVAAVLDEVDALIGAIGARVFTPFVLVERAELARLRGDPATRLRVLHDAHRSFADMGATGHARRIAAEIAAA